MLVNSGSTITFPRVRDDGSPLEKGDIYRSEHNVFVFDGDMWDHVPPVCYYTVYNIYVRSGSCVETYLFSSDFLKRHDAILVGCKPTDLRWMTHVKLKLRSVIAPVWVGDNFVIKQMDSVDEFNTYLDCNYVDVFEVQKEETETMLCCP